MPGHPAPAEKSDKSEKNAKEAKDKKAPLAPGEVVSKNDYQVNQAINLLKGLQIMQTR